MEYIYIVAGGLLLFALISVAVRARGYALARKFAKAGPLAGKTKTEIIALVGPPNAVSVMPQGKTLNQWLRPGYHIALLFEGEICESVTHEFRL